MRTPTPSERIRTTRLLLLNFLHLFAAAATRLQVAAFAGRGALGDLNLAAAFRIRAPILLTLFKGHSSTSFQRDSDFPRQLAFIRQRAHTALDCFFPEFQLFLLEIFPRNILSNIFEPARRLFAQVGGDVLAAGDAFAP